MKRETLIESSYEAAFLVTQGFEYKPVPRADGSDVEFGFRAGKKLEEARQRYMHDIDVVEFVDAHRRVKAAAQKALLQDRKRDRVAPEKVMPNHAAGAKSSPVLFREISG